VVTSSGAVGVGVGEGVGEAVASAGPLGGAQAAIKTMSAVTTTARNQLPLTA
jgi:hypothetical protein